MLNPSETTVFIFAAGRGKRMRPLTDTIPKPLLTVGDSSLIEHILTRLSEFGFKNYIINIDHLGEQITEKLKQGQRWGINIQYSDERDSGALETAGAIQHAYSLIQSDEFLCINADIWTNFDFQELLSFHQRQATPASIVLVPNPQHNDSGDFCIDSSSSHVTMINQNKSIQQTYTFSGIGLYSKSLFSNLKKGKSALAPLLYQWCQNKQLSGLIYQGSWQDIGTPERLAYLNKEFSGVD